MNNYNFQNAEINAKLLASKIQLGLGNSNAALDTLKNVVEAAPSDPENENRFYSEAYYLIAFIFNNKGDSEKALPYYIKCAELAIPAFSGKANFELGQNALKQKKYNIALRYFLRNVLLYKPDTAGRKDSLVLVIDIMTKSKDKRLPTYQDILKRDYPDFK
ncbi:MAG: hypothetical protein GY718_20070 [Lentisphaerae bacterium]|nr:hypothetical protein [Lentisphaerota bacterium]